MESNVNSSSLTLSSSRSLTVTLNGIKNYFGDKSNTAYEWQRFVNPFLPIHDSVQEYLRDIDWNSQTPFKKQLFGSKYPVNQNSYIPAVESSDRIKENKDKSKNYYFDGLKVVYGKSTASVKHSGNNGQVVPDHREILVDEAMAINPEMAKLLFVKSILSLPFSTKVDKIVKYLTEGNIKFKKQDKEGFSKTYIHT